MSDRLHAVPLTRDEVEEFIGQHHRHHLPPVGWVFHVALARGEQVVGVATVGRPVARRLDTGWTAEVTRLCTLDAPEAEHAASKLYAMAWRIAREMGYQRLVTYTLAIESGTSLRAAGWRVVHQTPGRSWNVPSRPRVNKHPLGPKTLWEVGAPASGRSCTDASPLDQGSRSRKGAVPRSLTRGATTVYHASTLDREVSA